MKIISSVINFPYLGTNNSILLYIKDKGRTKDWINKESILS